MFKAMKKKLKDQRGLTLIELLAVVVILGIIAAIAVPSIGNLIDKTEDDAIVAEGIQIINSAKLYVASNNPPTGTALNHATHLNQFIDNVKEDDYIVTVTKDANGSYTYSLTGHDSVALVDKDSAAPGKDAASESELLAY